MILTCPECATSYFVDDGKIGAQGRSVRCAGCGNRWTAHTQSVLELRSSSEQGAVAFEAATLDEPVAAPLAEVPAPELPKVFRARTEAKRNIRQAAAAGAVWAAMGACAIALVGVGVVFKVDVVRIWPRTASAYALAGMPVNATGLEFEDIAARPALQDGHAALVVSGKIRNVEDHTISAPPLLIGLYDTAGKKVGTKVSDPENAAIPPGETRHFVVSLVDPPATAKDVEVAFVLDPKKSRSADKAPTAKLVMRGPTADLSPATIQHVAEHAPPLRPEAHAPAVEATPLPASDPHALPHG